VEDNESSKNTLAIGLMSGTSLDGVDIAYCSFSKKGNAYNFNILACETVSYDEEWKLRLSTLHTQDALTFARTHVDYGRFLGRLVKSFIDRRNCKPAIVASHGHTIFHQPTAGFTSQIGDGAALATECGLPVVCDFRSSDVAYGGQGAPLVPIGDELLFGNYDCCLNLGGFGNISFKKDGRRIAYDICPVNIALNYIAMQAGLDYDEGGTMAASGKIIAPLLDKLNNISFYHRQPPKSLGREWFENELLPLLQSDKFSLEDILQTLVEHIAIQIGKSLPSTANTMIVTGGGAFNKHLISRVKFHCNAQVILPDREIINYKEALIFAFLGLLRIQEIPNCMPSVTGASKPAIGGAVYLP